MRGEKREAKMDGARAVKNSGRGMLKGDASIGSALIDYKHYSNSFSISKKNWQKHCNDASDENYDMGMYSVILGEEDGTEVKVAIIDWEWFMYLWGLYEKDEYGDE